MIRLRGAVLTVGAVVGSLCVLVALAGVLFDVRALVFRSGSMGPEVPAGALGLSRPIAAADLKEGDIVSVVGAGGTRVTHRIVRIADGPDPTRVLTLKGDVNSSPDAEGYAVNEADRVFWSVPVVGYIVAWFDSPIGLLVLGGAAVGVLVLGFGPSPKQREPGRRRAMAAVAAPVVVSVILVHASSGTAAAFADNPQVTSKEIDAGSAVSSGTATTPCTADNPLLGTNTVTIRWKGVSPPAAPAPPAAQYEYRLTVIDRDTGQVVGNPAILSQVGAAGSDQSQQYTASLLSSLLGLDLTTLLLGQRLTMRIVSRVKATTWVGGTTTSINFRVVPIVQTFACS